MFKIAPLALRALPAAAIALAIALPAAAPAQQQQPYQQQPYQQQPYQQQPPNSQPYPPYTYSNPSVSGTIDHFDGQWTMWVRDSRGYLNNVSLRQGTVINPTGITLQPGFQVTVYGTPSGNTFAAAVINTPYNYAPRYYGGYGYPYGGYGGYGYGGYPYPYYGGYPFYGPVFSLNFGFGPYYRGGYYRGGYYRGAYYRPGYYRAGYYRPGFFGSSVRSSTVRFPRGGTVRVRH